MGFDLSWSLLVEPITWPFLWSATIFFLASTLLASRFLPFRVAYVVVLIKYVICVGYFTSFAGSWFVGADDAQYFETGLLLSSSGFNPFNIWKEPLGQYVLLERTSVTLIHYWNMIWLYLIENKYYSVIFPNVFLTVISALIFDKLLSVWGANRIYRLGFSVYFLLHWDTIAWSSFLDLKEPLVFPLLLSTIYFFARTTKGSFIYFVPLTLSLLSFYYVRFYFPVFLVASVLVNQVLFVRTKWITNILILIVFLTLCFVYKNVIVMVFTELVEFSLVGYMREVIRMILSPVPWLVTDSAGFLLLGSVLHWLMLPVALIGVVLLIRDRSSATIVVALVGVMLLCYALVPAIASMRHRSPAMILWILFEYHGLFTILACVTDYFRCKDSYIQTNNRFDLSG